MMWFDDGFNDVIRCHCYGVRFEVGWALVTEMWRDMGGFAMKISW